MTDYSTAIWGLVAAAGLLTSAVLYVLAQPTDIPVIQRQS